MDHAPLAAHEDRNAGFTQTFGATAVSQHNPNAGVYAQDEWKITPGVTLNAGLRYDLQFLRTITTDTNNVSPRVGVAWTPTASGRTIVRAGAARMELQPLRTDGARSPPRVESPSAAR